uniref:Choline transporter-like protein n=1 Tax=Dicentrarchus labrax TaxID=13489 RepID=A0A8C4EZR1_DICLA
MSKQLTLSAFKPNKEGSSCQTDTWLYGDPRHVLYARNSTGWFCGTGPNKDKPNLFYFDILKCATSVNIMASSLNGFQCPTTQVCVETCPNDFWAVEVLAYLPNVKPAKVFNQSLCVPSIDLATTDLVSPILLTLCKPCVSPCELSVATLENCYQQSVSLAFVFIRDIVNGFNAREIGVRIFEDFASSWPWILIGLLIAMVVSMLFLLLLRFTAPVMVWVLIIGVLAAGAYGIWHCYWEYDNYKQASSTISDIGFTTNFSVYLQVQETWLAFLCPNVMCLCGCEKENHYILMCLTPFSWRNLVMRVFIFHRAISHMMSSLFYPLVTFVLLLVCQITLCLHPLPVPFHFLLLHSSFSSSQNFTSSDYPGCPSASCIFIKYNDEGLFQRNLFNLQIYNVVAFLWCVNFVIALGQCTLAGAFASYYWAFTKPGDIPMFPVSASFIRSLRYHVGSLAFGALILTLVQLVRIILEYIDHKTRAAQNPCARFLMCCLKCCFWCLEKFIKFLNRNAYIMIAIYGKNFCVSAKNAFMLLMRNVIRVVVLDKVTDLLLFFGKLLVVGGVGVLSFFFFSGRILLPGNTFRSETLNYYWMPIITVVFGSYLIAHGFFSVYNMCVDTLFLCFLEDLERNDGSLQKPYFMSKNLMKILNKTNKAPKKGKGKD